MCCHGSGSLSLSYTYMCGERSAFASLRRPSTRWLIGRSARVWVCREREGGRIRSSRKLDVVYTV
jgi:hypothetical protein